MHVDIVLKLSVQKKEASIKYYGGVEKMRQEEMQKQQADDAEQSQRAERQLHTVTYKLLFVMCSPCIVHWALERTNAVWQVSSFALQDAFVKFLNGTYLFESMFKNDPEAETLQSVAGVADLFKTYPLILGLLINAGVLMTY